MQWFQGRPVRHAQLAQRVGEDAVGEDDRLRTVGRRGPGGRVGGAEASTAHDTARKRGAGLGRGRAGAGPPPARAALRNTIRNHKSGASG